MPGSMGRMYIGTTGLQANQYAMNATAHNIANMDNDMYSRQNVILTDMHYQTLTIGTRDLAQTGTGTKFSQTRQVRDVLMDRNFRKENGRQSYYETMFNNIYEVQDYFGELQGSTFQNNMSDFWKAWEELAKDTNNIVTRSSLVAYAGNFVSKANEIYTSLTTFQKKINTEIDNQVKRINELAQTIYKVNKEITKIEASHVEKANDLRDQRNAAIDELSALIDVDIHENPDLTVEVYAERRLLVTTAGYFEMETQLVEPGSPFVKPVWKDDQTDVIDRKNLPCADNKTDTGTLKALMMSRGYEIANFTDIPVNATQQEIDDYNLNLEPYSIPNLIAQFDQLIHGMVTAVNDKLCPNVQVTADNGTVYNILDFQYDGLTKEDGEALGMTFAAGVGMGNGNQVPGTELFVRSGMDRYTKETITINGKTVEVSVFNEEDLSDFNTLYTLGYIELNESLVKNPSLMPISMPDGGEFQDRVKEIVDLWNQDFGKLNPNTLVNEKFNSYYKSMIDDFADKGYTYNALSESAAKAVKEYDDRRQQQLGVSSEEELTNLIRFQSAYNASSRYITVVSQMLEHIIERLGS